eukprot:scaffold2565_cov384-Prasinococcus_capsulatus_cf.AAC.8
MSSNITFCINIFNARMMRNAPREEECTGSNSQSLIRRGSGRSFGVATGVESGSGTDVASVLCCASLLLANIAPSLSSGRSRRPGQAQDPQMGVVRLCRVTTPARAAGPGVLCRELP